VTADDGEGWETLQASSSQRRSSLPHHRTSASRACPWPSAFGRARDLGWKASHPFLSTRQAGHRARELVDFQWAGAACCGEGRPARPHPAARGAGPWHDAAEMQPGAWAMWIDREAGATATDCDGGWMAPRCYLPACGRSCASASANLDQARTLSLLHQSLAGRAPLRNGRPLGCRVWKGELRYRVRARARPFCISVCDCDVPVGRRRHALNVDGRAALGRRPPHPRPARRRTFWGGHHGVPCGAGRLPSTLVAMGVCHGPRRRVCGWGIEKGVRLRSPKDGKAGKEGAAGERVARQGRQTPTGLGARGALGSDAWFWFISKRNVCREKWTVPGERTKEKCKAEAFGGVHMHSGNEGQRTPGSLPKHNVSLSLSMTPSLTRTPFTKVPVVYKVRRTSRDGSHGTAMHDYLQPKRFGVVDRCAGRDTRAVIVTSRPQHEMTRDIVSHSDEPFRDRRSLMT